MTDHPRRSPDPSRALGRRTLISRRLALAGLAGAACALGRAAGSAGTSSVSGTVERTSLHQELDLNASPERVFDVLLDAKAFSAFTGDSADVRPEAGAAFSLFGGRITGRNVELVRPERIVQAWRSRSWDAGAYSVVRFALAERSGSTRLVLDHTGFPDGDGEHLAAGWREHYWDPLHRYLG